MSNKQHFPSSAYIKMVTDGFNDLARVVDNLLAGYKQEDQIETLIELGTILEERKAMREVLKGLTREIHTRRRS